jgi:hypothetical protein
MNTIPPLSRLLARTFALLLVALVTLAASVAAFAAPHLYADPYPATGVQPDSVTMTVNGGAPQACELTAVAGGLQPRCDLAALTAGTYTLVMTASRAAGCSGSTCWAAGSASSAPFSYTRAASAVAAPTGLGLQP